MRYAAAALALVLTAAALAGCGDRYSGYCSSVSDHQEQLAQTLGQGGGAALFQALPTLTDLRDKAPADIRGDWDQLVTSIQGLQSALQAAGVDPSTYDRKHPPAGVTAAQKAQIDAAARALGGADTTAAAERIQDEVRDVCHTPLSI